MRTSSVLSLRPAAGLTTHDMVQAARVCDKSRLEVAIYEGEQWVRAAQGHTINITDDIYVKYTGEADILHGTTDAAWHQIYLWGIRPMDRQHVNFAVGLDDPHLRQDSTVIIWVAASPDLELLQAANGVVLTRHTVAPCYFTRAWHTVEKRELLGQEPAQMTEEVCIKHTREFQVLIGDRSTEYNIWYYSTEEQKRTFPVEDKTRQDKTRQDKTRQDKTRHGKAMLPRVRGELKCTSMLFYY